MSRALGWIAFGATVAAWVASSILGGGSREEGIAEVRLELADSAAAHAREDSARNAELAARYSADSAQWEADRTVAREQAARATASAAAARRQASAIATDLAVLLEGDSTETAMLAAHLAEDDSIDVATDAVIAAQAAYTATVEAERDDLRVQLFGAREELGAIRAENVQLRSAIESLQDRLQHQDRENSLLKLGAGALVAKAGYDLLTET